MIFKCFLGVFLSVLEAYFECFIYLQMYVASVASRCFKSKSGVAAPLSLLCCLVLVPSPPLCAGWASSAPLLLFPMLVTFRTAQKTYAGSGWEGRRRSPRGMRVPKVEGAWARSGMMLGCPDGEEQRGRAASTCAQTRVNGAAGTDVRTRMSIHPVKTLVRPLFNLRLVACVQNQTPES
jgi:hypothetical protein